MKKNNKVAVIINPETNDEIRRIGVHRFELYDERNAVLCFMKDENNEDKVNAIIPSSMVVILIDEEENKKQMDVEKVKSENLKPTSFEWALSLMRQDHTMVCGGSEFRVEDGLFLEYINNRWVQSTISSEMLDSKEWHFPHYKG